MFLDILKIENPRIPIAKKEISNPLKGRNVNAAALTPKSDSKPIPHAAHPGTRIPRKIPTVPKIPILAEPSFIIIVLYVIRLNNIPSKTLIEIKLMNELKRIVSLNPKKRFEKNLNIWIKPFSL